MPFRVPSRLQASLGVRDIFLLPSSSGSPARLPTLSKVVRSPCCVMLYVLGLLLRRVRCLLLLVRGSWLVATVVIIVSMRLTKWLQRGGCPRKHHTEKYSELQPEIEELKGVTAYVPYIVFKRSVMSLDVLASPRNNVAGIFRQAGVKYLRRRKTRNGKTRNEKPHQGVRGKMRWRDVTMKMIHALHVFGILTVSWNYSENRFV